MTIDGPKEMDKQTNEWSKDEQTETRTQLISKPAFAGNQWQRDCLPGGHTLSVPGPRSAADAAGTGTCRQTLHPAYSARTELVLLSALKQNKTRTIQYHEQQIKQPNVPP